MALTRFTYIWQYEVVPTRTEEFLAAYGASGEWAQFFSQDPAYLGTTLLRETGERSRYLTIDYWRSKSDRDSFKERYSAEFDELDHRCEELTADEQFVGDFIECVDDEP